MGEGTPPYIRECPIGGAPFPVLRRIVYLGFVLFAALAVSSCGLESSTYYYTPSFTFSGTSGPIVLQHNTANTDSSFLGYEVYYRVYYNDAAGNGYEAADADYVMISSTVQNTDVYTPTTALNKLKAQGFVRLLSDTDYETYFHTTSSSSTKFTIQLDNSVRDWYFIDSSDSSTQTAIYRNTGSTGVSFNTTYTSGDDDYDSSTTIGSGKEIYIVMFAVAYGFDLSSSGAIYSLPVVCSNTSTGSGIFPVYALPDTLYDD
jgi:hypothetical protein